MTSIRLFQNSSDHYVMIPGVFIEKYLANANGEFVKVYLYLLHAMNVNMQDCSISNIADYFNHTEKDVIRALKYWEKAGVLKLERNTNNQIEGIGFCNLSHTSNEVDTLSPNLSATSEDDRSSANASSSIATVEKKKKSVTKKKYTLDEVKVFSEDPEIAELLFIMETYLKHPLTSSEMNTVFFWIDELHFSRELIEYLVEYCITNGHSSLRYMDKVAMGWAEDHVSTVALAKEHSMKHSKAYYSVIKALGISGRNLVDSEINFINKWTSEYNFDLTIIEQACSRTISATHQPSFEYTDSILSNWHKQNVQNMKDVEALDLDFNKQKKSTNSNRSSSSTKNNKFNNFNQRNYDYEQLEKVLLNTSV